MLTSNNASPTGAATTTPVSEKESTRQDTFDDILQKYGFAELSLSMEDLKAADDAAVQLTSLIRYRVGATVTESDDIAKDERIKDLHSTCTRAATRLRATREVLGRLETALREYDNAMRTINHDGNTAKDVKTIDRGDEAVRVVEERNRNKVGFLKTLDSGGFFPFGKKVKRRFFVLRSAQRRLLMYTDSDSSGLLGKGLPEVEVQLRTSLSVKQLPISKHPLGEFVIDLSLIDDSSFKFEMGCKSKEECQSWMDALQHASSLPPGTTSDWLCSWPMPDGSTFRCKMQGVLEVLDETTFEKVRLFVIGCEVISGNGTLDWRVFHAWSWLKEWHERFAQNVAASTTSPPPNFPPVYSSELNSRDIRTNERLQGLLGAYLETLLACVDDWEEFLFFKSGAGETMFHLKMNIPEDHPWFDRL